MVKIKGFFIENLSKIPCKEMLYILITLGKIDFRPLRKFNGANFYILFVFFSEEPIFIEKKDLAKCPL